MSTYCCKLCNEEIKVKNSKIKFIHKIRTVIKAQKHLKEKHNMGFWDVIWS